MTAANVQLKSQVKGQKKGRGVFGELRKNFMLYLLALPAIAYTFLFGYATLPYIIIAFEKYSFRTGLGSKWIGMTNFNYFFHDFFNSWGWTVTRNTIFLNFLFIVSCTICAVAIALLLNEVRSKFFLKVSQSAMLLPFFISWVIVSYIMEGLLKTDTGLINKVLTGAGMKAISFYSSPQYWYVILIVVRIWKVVGYTSIIYLAVITGIDEGLYEASYIDGANRMQRIIYITIPLMIPTISILTLMDIGRIFYGDFGMFYAIIRDNGSLMPMAEVIDTYVFRQLKLTGDPGIAMAVGLYQSVVGFILVFGSNAITRRFYPEGSLF